jgi:hypothetical protein
MFAVLLDHGSLARDDVEELVLLFVPVPLGGARPRRQCLDVGAVLGQPASEYSNLSRPLVPSSTGAWSLRMIISLLPMCAVAVGELPRQTGAKTP